MTCKSWASRFTLFLMVIHAYPVPAEAADTNNTPLMPEPLSLQECVRRVVDQNESIQMRSLEWLASQKRLKAAKGIFEPDWVASIERDENYRKNTAQQHSL